MLSKFESLEVIMGHHGGSPETSVRLKLTLSRLERGPATTLELQEITGSMAPATDVADLRKAGIPIGPARFAGTTSTGRKIYRYEMIKMDGDQIRAF